MTESKRLPHQTLDADERRILSLIGRGLTNREIGILRGVTEAEARRSVHQIVRKLGLTGRTHAANYAIRHGLAPHPGKQAGDLFEP